MLRRTISSSSLIPISAEIAGAISTSWGFEDDSFTTVCHSDTSFPEGVSLIRDPTRRADAYWARNLGRASFEVSFPFGLARISMEIEGTECSI